MTTTLPALQTVAVATKATAHYLARLAATRAGGTPVDFMAGIVRVGDGDMGSGPQVPLVSDLLTAGDVLHEVGTGSWIHAVTVNPQDETQVDILVVIPAENGGVELGPWWVTEFAITDENGDVCLVGTTAMAKFVSNTNGAISDLAFIASEKESSGNVILTPPSSNFLTMYDLIIAFNANLPVGEEPIYTEDTTLATGFKRRTFKIRRALNNLLGVGRPATDAEFAAGQAAEGAYPWPWPTLQQISSLVIPIIPSALAPLSRNMGVNRYEIALSTGDNVRSATSNANVVTPKSVADASDWQTLADAATITWDWAAGFMASVELGASRTLAYPTHAFPGATGVLKVKPGGARTLTFGAGWVFDNNVAPVGSTAANVWDIYSVTCLQTGGTPRFLVALVAQGVTL